ncbi:RTA1 like protein-domain-containing protein [Mycena latifolia]|nr:RTA1 like protein-domain-containing protein [Mycena latifolia]
MVHVKCLDPLAVENDVFLYCPSLSAAVLFTILFGLTTIVHVVQAVHYAKRLCWVVIMAGLWETGGLLFRSINVINPTSVGLDVPSQLLILLAPVWLNAFLYVLMSRMVYYFVPDKRIGGISAQRLSVCFVLLDVTSFIVQAAGGSLLSSDSPSTALTGVHIYMGGIGMQQLFILGFISLVVRFHYKMKRNPAARPGWKRLLYAMYASLTLITIRIIFRLVEFSAGVFSNITMHEAPFYCLDALPMFAALLVWNAVHPGQVLVGPESEFPTKAEAEYARSAEKEVREEHSLTPLVPDGL